MTLNLENNAIDVSIIYNTLTMCNLFLHKTNKKFNFNTKNFILMEGVFIIGGISMYFMLNRMPDYYKMFLLYGTAAMPMIMTSGSYFNYDCK